MIPALKRDSLTRLDVQAIKRNNPLPEVAARLMDLKAKRGEWTGCCPFHAEHTPSFTIFDGGQRFHCFGCGATGDVLDFVMRAYRVTLRDAAEMLAAGEVPKVEVVKLPPAAKRDTTADARAIWDRAAEAVGTLGEAYLRWRGILPPYPPSLRFLWLPYKGCAPMPCLICAVQDVTGEVIGIQRIFLAPDGQGKADVAEPKLSLGTIRGGAIRLGDLNGTAELTVCEGPEDGLSLAAMLQAPVWVSAGTSNLPAMQFPLEVQSILIGADNDPAGREAADKAARAFTDRGLRVRIIRPLDGFKDFNDELKGA